MTREQHIRKYIHARGGIECLTEAEKTTLAEAARRGPPKMSTIIPLDQYRMMLNGAVQRAKELLGRGNVKLDKGHVQGLDYIIGELRKLKTSASAFARSGMPQIAK